jgi:sporulation protein YabP
MENGENKQLVLLENRKKLTIDNVMNVDSFTEDYLEITTKLGDITVEGENLKIEELRQDEGKILITGTVNGFFYKAAKPAKGLFGNLFK